MIHKIFGPPGTGKTHYLLEKMEELLRFGVVPSQIGFFSFTNKAADEARNRAMTKFSKFPKREFGHFRTLHSHAFNSIGGTSSHPCMKAEDWHRIAEALNIELSEGRAAQWGGEFQFTHTSRGDKMKAIHDLSRLWKLPIARAHSEFSWEGIAVKDVDVFARTLAAYKESNDVIDFVDMLTKAIEVDQFVRLKALFIDEAQDLSALQWDVVELLLDKADVTYIAGDDDQAIFKWSGADVERFIDFPGEPLVLKKSYRVPQKIAAFANRLLLPIRHRVEKEWEPRQEEGEITYHFEFDPEVLGMREGSWMVLVRNKYLMDELSRTFIQLGYFFSCSRVQAYRPEALTAIMAWSKLTRGEAQPLSSVKVLYDFMSSGKSIVRGYKELLSNSKEETLSYIQLQANYGLAVPLEKDWWDALDRLSHEEIDYFRECRRNHESLLSSPRIILSTIHGVKGGEADNVVLFSDISRLAYESAERNPDDEARVFFVGATRARKTLHIILPQKKCHYEPLITI